MNLKLKAALITGGYFAGLICSSYILMKVGSIFTTDQIVSVIGWSFIVALVYGIYQLVLSRLEHQRMLNKMENKYE
jgi:hypothetical protein